MEKQIVNPQIKKSLQSVKCFYAPAAVASSPGTLARSFFMKVQFKQICPSCSLFILRYFFYTFLFFNFFNLFYLQYMLMRYLEVLL